MERLYILGISCFYHDSAACLLDNGHIVAAAQEERFSRKKHDPRFPTRAVQYCLSEAGIAAADLAYVAYYDKPFLTFERLLMSYLSCAPKGLRSWLEAMPLWLGKKLHIPKVIRKELDYPGQVLFTEHHEAHAAAAFFPSPFESAAILTMDGVGEWATASFGTGRGNGLNLMKELRFPDSLGLLYSAFTYFCGFRVNSGEYKLMGLAPYGEPRFKDLILSELVDVKADGSIRLDLSYFDFVGGMRMTNKRFASLFGGPARAPESEITPREMDIAASIQAVTEEIVLKMVRHVHKETGQRNLCLAGGVALNCVANGRILREGPFEKIWIQPAAGDAGGALGAALSAWHRFEDKERKTTSGRDSQQGCYLGPGYGTDTIEAFLNQNGYPYHQINGNQRADRIAGLIAQGHIVGYMAGRMEFGPRALGARSILGDPRSAETQRVMNLKIKFRESFRPFAPSVLEEKVGACFEMQDPSPYMLLVTQVKKERCFSQTATEKDNISRRLNEKRSDIPAVTHLDYSARIQTVSRQDKPDYHAVIAAFEKLTGYPLVVNTSFNVRGEPIICTPDDAYRCFMRTDMDVLVMENALLFKNEQPPWEEREDWRDELILD